jgi:putative spermidine/putrescine transport system substrate-binding protein
MGEHEVNSLRAHALGMILLSLLLGQSSLTPLSAQEYPDAPQTQPEEPTSPEPDAAPPEELAPEDRSGAAQTGEDTTRPAEPAAAPATDAPPPPADQRPMPTADEAAPPAAPPVTPATEPAPPSQPAPAPVIAAPPPAPIDPKDVHLKIASPGGAYMKSQERAYFQPFARRTGYKVSAAAYDGSLAALRSQAGAAPAWDVVDIEQAVAAQACDEGLLERIDAALVEPGPDGAPPVEDFLPGAFQPCGIANVAWSAVIVYDRTLKNPPTKAEHVFDLKRYPGKRALPRSPRHTLELTLLADGVAPKDIYTQLATREGQDRAFAKLNAIKPQIVWWEKPRDAIDKIARKQATMGLAYNGRAFMAQVKERQPVAVLWDHQIYHLNYWAIPKGAGHAGPAREFIGFATGAGPMADQTRHFPYGPARLSAVRLSGKHADINLDMKPHLPTHQPNLQGALAFDGVWWSSQEQVLGERFNAWIEGRETGASESSTSQ